jgi:hypothetical protein
MVAEVAGSALSTISLEKASAAIDEEEVAKVVAFPVAFSGLMLVVCHTLDMALGWTISIPNLRLRHVRLNV